MSRQSFVYFAVDEKAALVKIGCSYNPQARVSSFRRDGRYTRIVAKVPGRFVEERNFHRRFGAFAHRDPLRTEWFEYRGELKAFVESIAPKVPEIASDAVIRRICAFEKLTWRDREYLLGIKWQTLRRRYL